MLRSLLTFFLDNKLVTVLLLTGLVAWGIVTAPFDWDRGLLPSDPVAVDAIPDLGENQQIVFTGWPGRSPQDVEDQVTYPLTTTLLGLPGVKSIRSTSMFGFSSIYVIFDDGVEFYWSRSRILEKLNALPSGLLPPGVQPALGPDATALGQVFWYTLEGRDEEGNPTGGWGLDELRSIQDFYVRYGLTSVEGVSEVASIGGYVREYQVDINPEAMRAYGISLMQVVDAVRNTNRDAGAQTIEINRAEYFVRGIGYIRQLEDLEEAVVAMNEFTPITLRQVARVNFGPAPRRGVLDKEGADVVGGVVVARYGANPMAVIQAVKEQINAISPGLPEKLLDDGRRSKVSIVPFYDRTGLIHETLGTLEEAITLEVLITILVILFMVQNLKASLLISGLLPISVLMVFIAMRYAGVDANIVALSGIAIAIGTMVDLGIIMTENILRHQREDREAGRNTPQRDIILRAAMEVGPAIVTAVSTTIVSFIPVFALEAAEGKLFRPLAFTKTFAIVAAVLVALFIVPAFAHLLSRLKPGKPKWALVWNGLLAATGLVLAIGFGIWIGWMLALFGLAVIAIRYLPDETYGKSRAWWTTVVQVFIVILTVTLLLAREWVPLGVANSVLSNALFVAAIVLLVLGTFRGFIIIYPQLLRWCLQNRALFLTLPVLVVLIGITIWFGIPRVFGFVPNVFDRMGTNIRTSSVWSGMVHTFPGLQSEFMPSLDEGSFLLMPTAMPHTGVEQAKHYLRQLDISVANIPEVEMVVGKLGRVESALDPAPVSMFENVINYKPEYVLDGKGHRMRFKTDREGRFLVQVTGTDSVRPVEEQERSTIDTDLLVPDKRGKYFRQWRDHIRSPDDIWAEIVEATQIPGVTSAPKLQPIETRLVMLQTGMRANMGIKVQGPDLETIEGFGRELERLLQEVPGVKREAVFADRIVGKPYLQLRINRQAIARYGLTIEDMQMFIETAIGGMPITTTVEGRERYDVRVRYPREWRSSPDQLARMYVPTPTGAQVPLGDLVDIGFERGPQMIRSENTFLTGYVLFDRQEAFSDVQVVNTARSHLERAIQEGRLVVPKGISYFFSGSYENQVRASKRLSILIPVVLAVIFLILYFQFRHVAVSLMVFSGITMAFAGGFIMLWLYGQDWFLGFHLAGTSMRELFQVQTIHLSVAVWVGFIALFGIATDDGVVMTTYLQQRFAEHAPTTRAELDDSILEAAMQRVRPCLMTTGTTILALLPILTSTGKGSDIMIPMAIPAFGGMTVALITLLMVPVLYSIIRQRQLNQTP